MNSNFPYYLSKEIGRGSFGMVFKGTTTQSNLDVAVKLLDTAHETHGVNEVNCLKRLPTHPHIVSLLDDHMYWISYKRVPYTAAVLEFCPGGDLYEYLQTYGRIDETKSRLYFEQLLSALRHAHAHDIYHRDIKLENLLIGADGNLKLCDWGLAAVIKDPIVPFYFIGSAGYMSPELHANQSFSPGKVDAWAAVCAIFMTFTGHPPFLLAKKNDWHFTTLCKHPEEYWKSFSKNKIPDPFRKMVESIFRPSQEENRPGVQELMQCEWLKKEWPTE